ncbi:MAG: type II toxin-antitoxin system CcdA family antitoxin [candidate division KSB1 bacterium]|nr:type II toxin-antitoxin system CcdA family antitoxin [candidate division KSB1 bacterium]MDZ7301393.1 type II toxin-antitoxin system CcdA family antitoxin [candidate division KSB1 bacterium]MDZ7310722.1 type II toxin-antitoxin system CcdA family antitoxin [candidate division KSB1 bacterium]
MIQLFDTRAPKKPANLSINSELLAKARELNINLSATLEAVLIEQLKQKQRALWRKQNAKAIQAYNRFVEEQGVFSDELRSF